MRTIVVLSLVFTCALAADENKADVNKDKIINSLARQLMIQQLFVEERIRSEGHSGLKQVRYTKSGSKAYHSPTWIGNSVASMHDHSNNIRTVGMGEFIAVLNGVEFRTRHNDYRLRMPSVRNTAYHAMEDVPFPNVPPAVLNKATVNEQIAEMREWFKAWKEQDYSKRDYRKYFKPILCYLEGAWTTQSDKIEESFFSDRHFLDASSWFDLQEKIRFTSYTGRKSSAENYAFLPTTLWEVTDGGVPVYAQWNYRILCQPLSRDLPLNRFRAIDDLKQRMAHTNSYAKHGQTRGARFQLNPSDKDKWGSEGFAQETLLDKLMTEIPGKDNGPANVTDDASGEPAYPLNKAITAPLNTGYYHRWFSGNKGAMGLTVRRRGYSDGNLFMAQTTQPKIPAMISSKCRIIRKPGGKKERVCQEWPQRWSYAIPMEIIYLTPLHKWNPYNIEYKGDYGKNNKLAITVNRDADGNVRNGQFTPDKAYNGTHSKLYAITPDDFFSGKELNKDPADTTRKGAYGVMDRNGKIRAVKAAGVRAFLPNIPGVGVMRTRYPIMPAHVEGSAIWKELEALKDIVMDQDKYRYMMKNPPSSAGTPSTFGNETDSSTMSMSITVNDPPGEHAHTFDLTSDDIKLLKSGKQVPMTTSQDNGHSHYLIVRYNRRKGYYYASCDNSRTCWDGHGTKITMSDNL